MQIAFLTSLQMHEFLHLLSQFLKCTGGACNVLISLESVIFFHSFSMISFVRIRCGARVIIGNTPNTVDISGSLLNRKRFRKMFAADGRTDKSKSVLTMDVTAPSQASKSSTLGGKFLGEKDGRIDIKFFKNRKWNRQNIPKHFWVAVCFHGMDGFEILKRSPF